MPKAIIMPRFGMTQEEATIVQWLAQPGQRVEKGDPICEVTTDKINMEVESTASGTLTDIQYPEGAVVPVTKVIAYVIGEDEELPSKPAPSAPVPSTEKTKRPDPRTARDTAVQPQVSITPVAQRMVATEGVDLSALEGSGPAGKITRQDVRRFLESQVKPEGAPVHPGKVRATPGARRLAKEHQVDLALVNGTGFQGRIQGSDLQAYLERQKTEAKPALEQVPETKPPAQQVFEIGKAPTIIPLDRMRLTIGQRMQASVQQIPHIMLSMDIDMSRAVSMRAALNTRIPVGQPQISMTAVLLKACAAALHEHPNLNSYLLGDQLHVYPDANIGVAVALEGGLIVPVVHQAGEKSLFQVGAEIADLSKRARDGKLKPEDVDGGTFTLSNLGMFGIDHFTAIINPPQVAILAAGQISRRFIPDEEGKAVVRSMMTATLSVDHRVIDGAGGARFLNTLRDILETAGSQWG